LLEWLVVLINLIPRKLRAMIVDAYISTSNFAKFMFVPAGVSPDVLPIPDSIDHDFKSISLIRQGIDLSFGDGKTILSDDERADVLNQLDEYTFATLVG
jgi:hypothetical protein